MKSRPYDMRGLRESLNRAVAAVSRCDGARRYDAIHEFLKTTLEGRIPYTELVALKHAVTTCVGVERLLGEALTKTDEEKVEQIVNRVLKSKKAEEGFLKFAKNVLTSLFKSLYTRRSLWRDGLILSPD